MTLLSSTKSQLVQQFFCNPMSYLWLKHGLFEGYMITALKRTFQLFICLAALHCFHCRLDAFSHVFCPFKMSKLMILITAVEYLKVRLYQEGQLNRQVLGQLEVKLPFPVLWNANGIIDWNGSYSFTEPPIVSAPAS